jgi:hypothetical protein
MWLYNFLPKLSSSGFKYHKIKNDEEDTSPSHDFERIDGSVNDDSPQKCLPASTDVLCDDHASCDEQVSLGVTICLKISIVISVVTATIMYTYMVVRLAARSM